MEKLLLAALVGALAYGCADGEDSHKRGYEEGYAAAKNEASESWLKVVGDLQQERDVARRRANSLCRWTRFAIVDWWSSGGCDSHSGCEALWERRDAECKTPLQPHDFDFEVRPRQPIDPFDKRSSLYEVAMAGLGKASDDGK